MTPDLLLLASLTYVAILFGVAFWADRRARAGKMRFLENPLVYTLSISVYCTSWTYYGAVGSAARNGLEFVTIYIGPTLVFVGWWALMRRLVRVGRAQNVTSIADFLSARFGKSPSLAALASLIAVVATLPYIALQLKAVALSFHMIAGAPGGLEGGVLKVPPIDDAVYRTAFWVACGMAVFTILFGTRSLDSRERHHGVVAAIAVEACVKLIAVIFVGLFALYGVADGPAQVFDTPKAQLLAAADVFDARWAALTFLSAAAVICLPRQFQVTVVECADERHGRVASWAFPLYLLLICIFVAPIALVGLAHPNAGDDPDFFVLTLPLSEGQSALALLVFLGGLSSATSMMIVACIALSTMISNHLVLPLSLDSPTKGAASGDYRAFLLNTRRVAICGVMGLGFLYFRFSGGGEALASIGLIAFAGAAQFLPGLIAALFWPRARASGAWAGLLAGFIFWFITLFLPGAQGFSVLDAAWRPEGYLGLEWLRPNALFGLTGLDPLVHALLWSLGANTTFLIGVSIARRPAPLELLQGAVFADERRMELGETARLLQRQAAPRDLFVLAQRILGPQAAHELFARHRGSQGAVGAPLPAASDALISELEKRLAANIGAASAHTMVSRVATGERISLVELMEIADETARIRSYSQRLEEQRAELEETARRLELANQRLRESDAQKDLFLSTVSHELRTPMAALRAAAEILVTEQNLDAAERQRFSGVIREETRRLTRLLDQILDMEEAQRGSLKLMRRPADIEATIDEALNIVAPLVQQRGVKVDRRRAEATRLSVDPDRVQQVLLNLLTNALKYNPRPDARILVETELVGEQLVIWIADNGPGIPAEFASRIFERFARAEGAEAQQGVGLGLAICQEIMNAHGGQIALAPSRLGGATFRLAFPLRG
ncbi:MAG: sensor histidine kinase [Neomegalonema sp.]|nr:sensor histidine kinase [Neomegalonema sp.]